MDNGIGENKDEQPKTKKNINLIYKKCKNSITKNRCFCYKELSIDAINSRIQKEFCYKTSYKLTDERLMTKYKDCSSVKKSIDKLNYILSKYINEEIKQKIIEEYLLELIPAGTKGVIRGNMFNKIIKL